MLGLETQYKLREFFQAIAEEELQVERQRQLLARLSDFEPFATFQRVNRKGDHKITALEIYSFLKDNDLKYVTLRDCQYVIKYFDLDQDGYLNYQEFMQLMLPCDDMYLRSAATQRQNYPVAVYERLPLSVERELTTLIEREIHYHTKSEKLRADLRLRYDFTSSAAFSAIDTYRENAINHKNIAAFMKLCGYYPTEGEVVAIIRRLDIDADQKISFEEFVEAMKPTNIDGGHLESSTSSYLASKYEEEKKRMEHSPLRASHLEKSPSRYNPDQSTYSQGLGAGLGSSSYLQAPTSSVYRPTSSPSRSTYQPPRESHSSPIRPSVGVTRDLLQKSANKSPSRFQQDASYSSPSRRPLEGSSYGGSSSYGAQQKRQSPLKQDDEEELVRAFKEQIKLETELEDAKVRLALQVDFNLMDAFQMIDQGAKGWVTSPELVDALSQLGQYSHKDDVYLFVRRYDKDSDGRLLYSDFCDAFTPKAYHHAQTLNSRKAYFLHHSYPKTDYFSRETRELLLKTFKVHFSVEESAEFLRKRLGRRPNFNVHDAFQAVDTDKNGYITRDEFKNMLKEYGFYATDSEITWLIDRYDKNHDGRISYSEFIDEILPKSPQRR